MRSDTLAKTNKIERIRPEGSGQRFAVLGIPDDLLARVTRWLATHAAGKHTFQGVATALRQPMSLVITDAAAAKAFIDAFAVRDRAPEPA